MKCPSSSPLGNDASPPTVQLVRTATEAASSWAAPNPGEAKTATLIYVFFGGEIALLEVANRVRARVDPRQAPVLSWHGTARAVHRERSGCLDLG